MARKSTRAKPVEDETSLPLDGSPEGRQKALDSTIDDLTKRFGDGTIVRLGDATHLQVDAISTGSLTVDIAIGIGGVPRGASPRFTDPKVRARRLSACMSWQRRSALAA